MIPNSIQAFNRLLETLVTDEQCHMLHQTLWGGVDSMGHNKNPDGSPFGDCYKCRVIRDAIHDTLRGFSTDLFPKAGTNDKWLLTK